MNADAILLFVDFFSMEIRNYLYMDEGDWKKVYGEASQIFVSMRNWTVDHMISAMTFEKSVISNYI